MSSLVNLRDEMDSQLDYFVKKFVENGWKQEDVHYVHKQCGFEVNPEANNTDYKYGFGIVFYTELLSYHDENSGDNVLTPWVCGEIEIEYDKNKFKYPQDNPVLDNIAKFVKKELEDMKLKTFYDEDAFRGIFSRPTKNDGYTSIKFYLNKHYPNGYWENHTLA